QDQRLSEVDMDEKKSMNTHLHMLESYANLSRAWKNEGLRKKLRELIEIFLNHIIHPKSCHFVLFFDEDWTPKSDVISFGHDSDGGLLYEAEHGSIIDSDKHWWPQAEAVVGFLNAYQLSGEEHFRVAAEKSWEFIGKYIVDHEHGEWFWKVSRDGVPSNDKYKVDAWKCPYHNSRTCFEVMARAGVQ